MRRLWNTYAPEHFGCCFRSTQSQKTKVPIDIKSIPKRYRGDGSVMIGNKARKRATMITRIGKISGTCHPIKIIA